MLRDHRGAAAAAADRLGGGQEAPVGKELDPGGSADLGGGSACADEAVPVAPAQHLASGEAMNAGSAGRRAPFRCEARGAAIASGSVLPRSSRSTRICSTVVMIVEPPGEPSASSGSPPA